MLIPAYPEEQDLTKLELNPDENKGQPIRYLISAPTMRIPTHINNTVNAYLAFRAVLRAGTLYCVAIASYPVCYMLRGRRLVVINVLIIIVQLRSTTRLTQKTLSRLFYVQA